MSGFLIKDEMRRKMSSNLFIAVSNARTDNLSSINKKVLLRKQILQRKECLFPINESVLFESASDSREVKCLTMEVCDAIGNNYHYGYSLEAFLSSPDVLQSIQNVHEALLIQDENNDGTNNCKPRRSKAKINAALVWVSLTNYKIPSSDHQSGRSSTDP